MEVYLGAVYINVREYRRGYQEWTIQRNWQHRVHKTQDKDKAKTPQKNNKVLGTIIRKET